MKFYHATTPKKLERYKATGVILPPVRFWTSIKTATDWALRVKRTIILEVEPDHAYPLPDHKPKGCAWWTDSMVREWIIVRSDQ